MAEPDAVGKYLFGEVRRVIENHVRLESDWMYAVSALFVLQSYVVSSLPRVFYLMIGGRFGRGKTNFLSLLMSLTNGKSFENVSVAALARELKDGATIGIDEYDVVRERDVQEVRDALVRGGYRSNAAPYVRYNAAKKENEHFPVFGPKCLTFRGGVEDALQSRGYIVTMGEVEGEAGYAYVLRNMFPRLEGIPEKLAEWGKETSGAWGREKVQGIIENGGIENVRRAVQVFGGNRDSELATVSCALAEVIGMDLLSQLRQASEARGIAISASQDEDLNVLQDFILQAAAGTVQAAVDHEGYMLRLKQTDPRQSLDAVRKARGDKRLTNSAFAALRREIGIQDSWLKRSNSGGLFWELPELFIGSLRLAQALPTGMTGTTGTNPYGESAGSAGGAGGVCLRRVDDQDAEEMADFLDAVRFALNSHPELSDSEHGTAIGTDLGLDPQDVRGRVTAVRRAIADGRTQGAVRT